MGPYTSSQIGIVDWGYINGLRMMSEGELKMTAVNDFVRKPVMTDDDRRQILAMASSPSFVFIQHTDDKEMFSGVNGQTRSAALALGYTEHVERVVYDDEGRPVPPNETDSDLAINLRRQLSAPLDVRTETGN